MSKLPSWKDLQTAFESLIDEHGYLFAERDHNDEWVFPQQASPRTIRIFVQVAAKSARKQELQPSGSEKRLWQLWLEFLDKQGWRVAQLEHRSPDATQRPTQGAPWPVLRNRIERAERQFTEVFQRSAACCQDLAEREARAKGSNDTSNPSPDASRLQISGPDDVYFLIEPYADGYTWRIQNDGLSATQNIRISVPGFQSFHADKGAFNDARPCNVPWPATEEIEPGEISKPRIFLTFESDCLRLGRINGMGLLVWPRGDDRQTQVWLIHAKVIGLSQEWRFQVNVTWTRGTKTIELADPNAATIASAKPKLNLTQSQEGGIAAAEKDFTDGLVAREKSRALREAGERTGSQPASDQLTEVRKLDRHIRDYMRTVMNVLAEASLTGATANDVREYIETGAAGYLSAACARVNDEDLAFLDRGSIDNLVNSMCFHLTQRATAKYESLRSPTRRTFRTGVESNFQYDEFPKVKHHWIKKERTVKNGDEELALGGGWGDPGDFAPYRTPRVAPVNQQQVTKWVDGWCVPGLTEENRRRIKAQLLWADSAFWSAPEKGLADSSAMKLAFDGVAKVLFEAGILNQGRCDSESGLGHSRGWRVVSICLRNPKMDFLRANRALFCLARR